MIFFPPGQVMTESAKLECDVFVPISSREATSSGQQCSANVLQTRAIASDD